MRKMLSQRLPGETRLAVLDDGRLAELHLLRDHDRLAFGTCHEAITREKIHGRWRAEIAGETIWLLGHLGPHSGTRVPVRIVRAPIAEPGNHKPAHAVEQRTPAELVSPWADATAVRHFPDDLGVDDLLDRAVSGLFPFAGGQLSLERTRAALVIDVDGTGVPLDLNRQAAAEIARLLRLFQVGGMVLVDFAGLANRSQRLELDAALATALKADPRATECTAINGFGLVQIVRPRTGPSVIDQLCGTRRNQTSTDTDALRLLADAARSQGAGPRTITATPAVIARLKDWPEAMAEAQRAAGALIGMVSDPAVAGYGHVHVKPV
jgi:ribonuclease G